MIFIFILASLRAKNVSSKSWKLCFGWKLSGLLEDVTFTEILCWFYLFKLIYSHHACQRKEERIRLSFFFTAYPPPPTPFLLSRFNPKNVLLHEVLQLQHLLLEINRLFTCHQFLLFCLLILNHAHAYKWEFCCIFQLFLLRHLYTAELRLLYACSKLCV